MLSRFKDLATGVYPLAVQMPEVGPGLTPRMMKNATRAYIKDELTLTEQRALEKELERQGRKKMDPAARFGSELNVEDIDDEEDDDEIDDSDIDSEDGEEHSDIEDEADTEDNDEEEEVKSELPPKKEPIKAAVRE